MCRLGNPKQSQYANLWCAQVLRDSLQGAGPAVPRAACALLRQLANSDALKEAVLARDGLTLIQDTVGAHLANSGGACPVPRGYPMYCLNVRSSAPDHAVFLPLPPIF